jgi:hypothetical protein
LREETAHGVVAVVMFYVGEHLHCYKIWLFSNDFILRLYVD